MDGTDLRIGFTCTQESLLAHAETNGRYRYHVLPHGETGVLYTGYGPQSFAHIEAVPVAGANDWNCKVWKIMATGDPQLDALAMQVALASEPPLKTVLVNPNKSMLDALDKGLTGIAWSPEASLLGGIRNLTLITESS